MGFRESSLLRYVSVIKDMDTLLGKIYDFANFILALI